MTVAGPSQCGKTQFVFDLLSNLNSTISHGVNRIQYCYSVWQNSYDELKNKLENIDFIEGLPSVDDFRNLKDVIVILDDLMSECVENQKIVHLFTVGSHHNRISVIYLTQNIFNKGKYSRTLSLNSNYIIIFRNPRDPSQISCLARQIFPNNVKYFNEAFNDAVNSQLYGFLIVDLKQETPDILRLRTLDRRSGQIYVYKSK